MTIFLRVLKILIKEQLNKTSRTLEWQTGYPSIYDQLLSSQKKIIIDALEEKIVKFVGTGNDEADSQTINKLIEAARVLVQKRHEDHKKPRDSGDTLDMLSNLIFHTNAFFSKLDAFNQPAEVSENDDGPIKLRLINHPYFHTPENIIYDYAARYIGSEIFEPSSGIDSQIRKQKEDAVLTRIQGLSEVIKPQFGLTVRKERSLQALADLASDNTRIITPPTTSSFGIPFLSIGGFFSVKMPTKLFNPGEGRFGKLFSLAESLVSDMSELEFQPAELPSSASVNQPT
ncbi:hypothetical protein [uncultured Legionella sp.]|uniref:hypothetical protein n=1 Tax=uncultured Legionella sp. TaxID=210934 RepID=UPI00262CB697|nr:hypothetical protein [uncultured Legionella sp.]